MSLLGQKFVSVNLNNLYLYGCVNICMYMYIYIISSKYSLIVLYYSNMNITPQSDPSSLS